VRENSEALDAHLTQDDLQDLDREFPPPLISRFELA
jgi:hypothetical protein